MKITLFAAIMANGNYMHGDGDYRWAKEVFQDFDSCALESGNCIVGRKTYDEYASTGGGFGDLAVVVVSRTADSIPGTIVANSPSQAIQQLELLGHSSALVGGGDSLLNAFLAEGLADEIIVNLTPELGGIGNHVQLQGNSYQSMELLSVRELGQGILRLHYRLIK